MQVRIQTTEDTQASVLFPIHSGSNEYAYLFLIFKQYTLQHPDVLKDEAFDNLFYFIDLTLGANPFKKEVRIKYLHSFVDTYDV